VFVDECMRPVLARWRALVLGTPGAATLSAIAPTAPPADTARHRIRTDAALEGTPSPSLGGWLYGLYFAVAIAEVPGLETLDIPHLEFMAAALGCASSSRPRLRARLWYAALATAAATVDTASPRVLNNISRSRASSPTASTSAACIITNTSTATTSETGSPRCVARLDVTCRGATRGAT
jgi:hypothetical protein